MAALGTFGLLAALVGLSAFQAYRTPKLAWASFAIPAIGTLLSILGMVGMGFVPDGDRPFIAGFSPWAIWFIGFMTMLVGSILFGVATVRAGVLSRRAGQVLALSAITIVVVGTVGVDSTSEIGAVLMPVLLGAFCLSWVVLGASALRRGPIVLRRPEPDGAGA